MKGLQLIRQFSISMITLCYKKTNLKYTIDEYDHFLCFLAAESDFDIRFYPSRLDLAVQEVDIFAFLQKIEKKALYIGCF